ncbi:putative leucine-rich repeat receptor-like protein kinase [Vitis vinifera]|uniref:non-specific serine/threonine protein kinase n=1 Tax=Vitis vinifera TaxID=29760 RepID=A0A438BRL6_VITVI|nr:putative leucine-rich repeat receptor-like protein kinase [Vitis vinifera]
MGVLKCKSLVQLRLVGNSLTGSFPLELCRLVNLSAIELDQNKFSGLIPPEIANCRRLQRLHLANNYFTSELPKEIGNLSELVTFNISSNFLTGQIPPTIVNCKMLQRLDLSRNSFVDALPKELGTLLQLELLKLSENKFSGNIPAALGNLSHLTELQMGGNLFSGEIPPELGALSSLQIAMNLSYNNLLGRIPPELGNLILLEFLLLNNNHLSGEIPSTFGNLSSLMGCNFSYNDLTGPLPSIPLFQNMVSSSFIGNEGLCGGRLSNCNGTPSFSSVPPSLESVDAPRGKIITVVAAVVGGISLILIVIILYFMRRPVEVVASLQDKEIPSSVSDIYFPPKEGFTFQDLVEATNNFHDSYVVGRGACGTVYKAVMHSGQTIAVKKLASNREGNSIDNSFRAEILTLGKIRHRNIVKLYGFCYHQGSNLLLYEYMARGSLGELLHGASCSLEWQTRFTIALGAAEGLAYLHHDCKPRIIHRDIKSNNILLDSNFEAHVGDFGLAKVVDMPQSKSMSAVAGSYGYIAPGELPYCPFL